MRKEVVFVQVLLLFLILYVEIFSGLISSSLLVASVSPNISEVNQYQTYNITVLNTNSPKGINFTQVVLVIPLAISVSGHGTSAQGSFKSTVNNSLKLQYFSWNNSAGIIKNGTSKHFWVNASLNTSAYFNIAVAALDTNGKTNQSLLTVYVNDTIPPFIKFISPTPSGGSVLNHSYIPVNVTSYDKGSGVSNITLFLYNSTGGLAGRSYSSKSPLFHNFTKLSDGAYTIGAIAFDFSGNTNQTASRRITINKNQGNCLSNWSCSWSSCINGTKTQSCIDLNGCNSTTIINWTTSCFSSSSSCSPLLNCTGWAPDCSTSVKTQTKTCIDLHHCTPNTVQTRNCSTTTATNTSSSPSFNLGSISPSKVTFYAIIFVIAAIAIIVAFMILSKLKKKSAQNNTGESNTDNMPSEENNDDTNGEDNEEGEEYNEGE